jgi:hypothetical protein
LIYLKRFSIPDKVVVEDSSCDDSTISLDNEFKFLDKLFHCSLGKELSLGITKDMIGRLEYSYILKDYSINGIYNTVTLELERKYYTFGISFYNITDIKTNGPKVWIYSTDGNWRFYHSISNDELSSLGDDFRSDKIELKSDIHVYMQYFYSNPLKYYVGKFLYDHRKSINSVITHIILLTSLRMKLL